ncbi:MAG: capsular biosynthesis protein [Cyclobacteriaceae bacterium]|nr:capsular biosynthesis protein [Cyclobacteriaceae bacterium]
MDIHSHLLAGLDDGVKSLEEAKEAINDLAEMGFEKLIITPHIMNDAYRNDTIGIQNGLEELKQYLATNRINIKLQAAAEYYLDEFLYARIINKESLLTFGDRYLLFETNFICEPLQMKEFIFQASSQGYRLVLAHPERYGYMTVEKAEDLRNRGVLFQLNSLSIGGIYSKSVYKMALQLIDKGWVDFLGSDCHNTVQSKMLKALQNNKHYQRACSLSLLNNTL